MVMQPVEFALETQPWLTHAWGTHVLSTGKAPHQRPTATRCTKTLQHGACYPLSHEDGCVVVVRQDVRERDVTLVLYALSVRRCEPPPYYFTCVGIQTWQDETRQQGSIALPLVIPLESWEWALPKSHQ